ncbi:MAG: DUF6769 family protein [Phocaeicola sp.]
MRIANRKFSSVYVVIMALVLLIAPLIPHHHHAGVVCAAIEYCHIDDVCNDEHTAHHESNHHSNSSTLCIENARYLVSETEKSHKASVDNFKPRPLIDLLFAQYYSALISDVIIKEALRYGDFIVTYKSAEVTASHGLRAPPSFLA